MTKEPMYLFEKFRVYGDRTAVIHDDTHHTFADLLKQVCRYQSNLANIPSGAVVALLSDYSFHAIALFLALADNGSIIVPIVTTVQTEIDDRIDAVAPEWILRIDTKGALVVERHPNGSDNHALIQTLQAKQHAGLVLFSSGSTGKPKAMVHDLDNFLTGYKDRRQKDLVMLVFLMFDHIGGINTLLNALSMGATLLIPRNRDADYIAGLIEKYKIQILPSSPTFLNLMLMADVLTHHDLSSLRMITYGTEPMQESLLKRLKGLFPKVKFLQTFGTSETGIMQTSSRSSDSLFMKLDDPNIEYKIVDGELWLRSKTQILGYLNASMESFTADGWFRTGDLVEEAEGGYIKIIGRGKEIINVGGEKVLPLEVESLLLQMTEISDCLVYGEKNSITGQTVVAEVVLKEGVDAVNIKQAVRMFCKGKVLPYKVPTKVNVVVATSFGDRFKKMRRKDAN